jgi:copper(I)-binding protein
MKSSSFFLSLAITLAALPAAAHDYTVGSIQIAHPWMRATPKGAAVAAGDMVITNKGAASERLIGGTSPVAGRFEIHRMGMDGGVMKMRPVEGGLEIKPGGKVELKPGSFHIMLMDLKQPLQPGADVSLTVVFEDGSTLPVAAQIRDFAGANEENTPGGAGSGGGHH